MMSVIFLKRTLYRHHNTALVFIVGGIAVVGVAVMMKNGNTQDDKEYHMLAGILIMVVAQFFHGAMYIIEEKFFGDYYLHPFYIVGWEGIWGLAFYAVFLTVVQFIPCNSALFCPYGKVEDTALAVN